MVRDITPADTGKLYPHPGPLLSARWNEDLVADCWGDLLRMAGSLKYGQATASLIVGKWSASARQNTLAAALKEWGTLRRTIHAARYLSDPAYRRKIARQLNWERWLPARYAAIGDPASFFSDLGNQAEARIGSLASELAGNDQPGEGFLAKAGTTLPRPWGYHSLSP